MTADSEDIGKPIQSHRLFQAPKDPRVCLHTDHSPHWADGTRKLPNFTADSGAYINDHIT